MDWLRLNGDGEIEFVSEEVKLVPEMQALLSLKYNKQKGDNEGRKKFRALQELRYMYLAYSPKSPYRDYTTKERIEEAKQDCNFPADWEESTELKFLIQKFIKGSQSTSARSLSTTKKFLEKFEEHLNGLDLGERNLHGAVIHDPKKIMDTLKALPDFLLTIQELERQANLGLATPPKSKGDHELGWMAVNKPNKNKQNESEDESR